MVALKRAAEQVAGAGRAWQPKEERRTVLSSHGPSIAASVQSPGQAAPQTWREARYPLRAVALDALPRTVDRKGYGLTWPSGVHWHPGWRNGRVSPQFSLSLLCPEPLCLAQG